MESLSQNLKDRLDKLVIQRLVNVRSNEDGSLALYKYNKKVFFKNLWNKHPELMEARGIVFDRSDGSLVSYPFTKVFNDGENMAGFKETNLVTAVEKINGFLGVVTMHQGELLITSSGSFDSPFVDMAKSYLNNQFVYRLCKKYPNYTFMFEICHPNDPHVIPEKQGAWLIGGRENKIGSNYMLEPVLDYLWSSYLKEGQGRGFQFRRPKHSIEIYGDILKKCSSLECKIEGYMCHRGVNPSVKVKSKYYKTNKFLARSKKDFSMIWNDPELAKDEFDEEFYDLIDKLPTKVSMSDWMGFDEQKKLLILREIL